MAQEIILTLNNTSFNKVEGAFVQGIGLYTLEQQYHTPEGIPLMTGPENYKIPATSDIPREFRVTLLRNSNNDNAVFSSKVNLTCSAV